MVDPYKVSKSMRKVFVVLAIISLAMIFILHHFIGHREILLLVGIPLFPASLLLGLKARVIRRAESSAYLEFQKRLSDMDAKDDKAWLYNLFYITVKNCSSKKMFKLHQFWRMYILGFLNCLIHKIILVWRKYILRAHQTS